MPLEIGMGVSTLYQFSAIFSFTYLTLMASMMLESLINQLPTNCTSFPSEINQHLAKWARNFELITNFVGKINSFFGLVLLIFMADVLFTFVLGPFVFLKGFEKKVEVYYIVIVVKCVIHFTMVVLVSHSIKQKVNTVNNSLMNKILKLFWIVF